MSYQILPIWTSRDGQDTSPIAITCRDMEEAERKGGEWIRSHGARPGFRILLTNDVTWQKVATVRPRGVRP